MAEQLSGPWRRAVQALNIVRLSVVGWIFLAWSTDLMTRKSPLPIAAPIWTALAAAAFAIAFHRWRSIPVASGGRPGAAVASIAAWCGLAAALAVVAADAVYLYGAREARGAMASLELGATIVAVAARIIQGLAFVFSCRAVALHLDRGDIARRALRIVVVSGAVVLIAVAYGVGVFGRGTARVAADDASGVEAGLVVGGLLAFYAGVMFLMLVSGLMEAIRERPSEAAAFD
ncbi:MAG: hypothetical protein U1F43_06280 [Myxococcota bacterium]